MKFALSEHNGWSGNCFVEISAEKTEIMQIQLDRFAVKESFDYKSTVCESVLLQFGEHGTL